MLGPRVDGGSPCRCPWDAWDVDVDAAAPPGVLVAEVCSRPGPRPPGPPRARRLGAGLTVGRARAEPPVGRQVWRDGVEAADETLTDGEDRSGRKELLRRAQPVLLIQGDL